MTMNFSAQQERIRELVYSPDSFARKDENDDAEFYGIDRFVNHLDDRALAAVRRLIGSLVVEGSPRVLDLMAGHDSHLPAGMRPARVVGLGLNSKELLRNAALDERVIHDLNRDPRLPFADREFDVVLNTVSVDYMTRPFNLFTEVGRVLSPGGLFLVIFSNRMFPEKAVRIWQRSSEQERILIVEDYFRYSGAFEPPKLFAYQGRQRPGNDKYGGYGIPSDPIYAVYAERLGAPQDRSRRVPPSFEDETGWDEEKVEAAKRDVGITLSCPYCDSGLKKWAVPQTPFTEWDTDFLRVCFNDSCPYLIRGFDTMVRQGNIGFSHRFMYQPHRDRCGSIPVQGLDTLPSGIIEG
jgi:SAM-dependent methyltransferase